MGHLRPLIATTPLPGKPVALREILDVIAEFGEASRELVAWELRCDVDEVAPGWRRALAEGLVGAARLDPISGEEMRPLSLRGQARLHDAWRPVAR
jgi:hypothetical protein